MTRVQSLVRELRSYPTSCTAQPKLKKKRKIKTNKKSNSSANGAGKARYHVKIKKLDPYPTPYIKINSKWINDLSLRTKTLKVFQENIGQKLHDTGFGNDFFDTTPKA